MANHLGAEEDETVEGARDPGVLGLSICICIYFVFIMNFNLVFIFVLIFIISYPWSKSIGAQYL